MVGKMKERATDKKYREYFRLLQNYTCQNPNCRRVYRPDGDLRNLTVSHFWGRDREKTRFDDENCDLFCWYPCHQDLGHGEGRVFYEQFMIQKLGVTAFNLLMIRAHTYKKRDDYIDMLIIKEKIAQLEQQRQPVLVSCDITTKEVLT